jgi:hypothetical protein
VAIDTLLGAHDGRQARACSVGSGWAVWAVDFGHDIGPAAWDRSTLVGSPDPTVLADPHGWFSLSTAEERGVLADALTAITDDDFDQIVAAVPAGWGPAADDRAALVEYLVRRREPVVTLIRQPV